MATLRAEMMEFLAELLAEYAEFQRRRPDLPRGDLRLSDLSEKELELLVTEFLRDWRQKVTTLIRHHRGPCSIELGHSNQHETLTEQLAAKPAPA